VIPLPGGFQPRARGRLRARVGARGGRAGRRGAVAARRGRGGRALAELAAAEWGPDGAEDGEAKRLARALHGTVPVIAGAELTAPVAYRWKCQINENAGRPAFASVLPELDHNEVVGWPGANGLGPFSAVFLEEPEAHPRNALRSELSALEAEAGARVVERVGARGETRLERLVSLVLLGDLVSLYMAVLAGTDPVDIAPIDRIKAGLSQR
jgi:glucose/mannose-6-phosphate isomerase